MTDKTDHNLIPAIKPAQDEVASYRRSGRSEAPRQSNFNGVLVFALVLMAIMMGIGGFALWEVQQRLELSNQLLDKSQQNMRDLEDRLSATGDTASQRFQSMEAQIQTNVSEIDKLWGVSYRTNRPNIQKNTEAITAVRTQIDRDLKQLSTRMTTVTNDFNKFSQEMAELRQGLLTDNQEMTTQVSLVRGQIQDQAVVVEGTRRNLAVIEQKMKGVEEAIDVIDRYRQQINQRLIDLQEQVQAVTSPSATSVP
ncbi:MAG: hypothetical protein ACFHX7_20670 [Pseudomonadota bacterium]